MDNSTKVLRDCFSDMKPLQELYEDETAVEYNNMIDEFWFNDFIINGKAYKLPHNIEEISIKIKSLAFPIHKGDDICGIIEIVFKSEIY